MSNQVAHPYKTTSFADNCALNYVKQVVGTVILVVEKNKQFIAMKRPVSTVLSTVFILWTSFYKSLQLSDTNISHFLLLHHNVNFNWNKNFGIFALLNNYKL